jgi:Fic family protein
MTAKRKPRRPLNEDAEQSRRFLETAAEIEAAGGLSPTEAEAQIERTFKRGSLASAKGRRDHGEP